MPCARVLSDGVDMHYKPLAGACSAALAASGGDAARKPRVRTQGGQRRIPEEPFVFDSEAQPIPVLWDNVPAEMAETRDSVHRWNGSTGAPRQHVHYAADMHACASQHCTALVLRC